MPIDTKKYLLSQFLQGDFYSAILDQRRFRTVDNQLHRIAEIIQDGIINGWSIEQSGDTIVSVKPGNGLINGFYVNTFNSQTLNFETNTHYSIYAQRRTNAIANIGPKSNVFSIEYLDTTPPDQPINFVLSATDFQISLSWAANTEIDLKGYRIDRSSDGSTFITLNTTTENFYEDNTTEEDTTYYYKIYALDESNNISSAASGFIITELSTKLPPNPVDVQIKSSESAINILWLRPTTLDFSKLQHYQVTYTELNSDQSENTATTKSFIVNKNNYNTRIDDLNNGTHYNITIQTVDYKDRKSEGITFTSMASISPAPRDPQEITVSMVESNGGVQVNLSWDNEDTPYDPSIAYRYKIYVTKNGLPESLGIDVPIGFLEEQISLYTFDLKNYSIIDENTIFTFRITALDKPGFESAGNYIRIKTNIFTEPQAVKNLNGDFDINNAQIPFTWINPKNISSLLIEILDADLEDAYITDTEIVHTFIDPTEIYLLSNVQLNHRYTIHITPYNQDNLPGPMSSSIAITSVDGGLPLPDPPDAIEFHANDRQVTLNWDESRTGYTKFYKLYKSNNEISFDSNNWTLVDTIPSQIISFTDYGLTNDQTYSYYITALDAYNRESLHLPDGSVNLNFVEIIPNTQSNLTQPDNINIQLFDNNSVLLSWDSTNEEFDAFTIYRSINNLHSWEQIAVVNKDIFEYHDIELPRVHQTIFYYVIDKTINDADIISQDESIDAPDNSLFLGSITTTNVIISIDMSQQRHIKNLIDPLTENTNRLLLQHKHQEINRFDPSRIDLNAELIITDWSTTDGRIFTTTETDITNGTTYIVKVDNKFPDVFFSLDTTNKRLIFAEHIATIDPSTGEITGTIPSIEVKIFGIEEVQNILDDSRFQEIHAKQIQFGTLNKEQLPELNHEGRIKETLHPKQFLLEKLSNQQFIVPQQNKDTEKTFGDGTTFFAVTESDGKIDEVVNFDNLAIGELCVFQKPSYSETTINNLKQHIVVSEIENENNTANQYIFDNNYLYLISQTNLLSIKKDTLSSDEIAVNSDYSSIGSLTINSIGNIAYTINGTTSSTILYSIDLGNGIYTNSVNISLNAGEYISSITYRPSNNTLYGCLISGAASYLITINTTTGITLSIGTLNPQTIGATVTGLAVDEDNDIMYGVNNNINTPLLQINPSTASTVAIGSGLGLSNAILDISYDHVEQIIYGITSTNLIEILINGTAINIGTHGITNIKSLSAMPRDLVFHINSSDGSVPGNDKLRLGNFYGFTTTTFLRFPINLTPQSTVTKAELTFFADSEEFSSGDNVRLMISVLDPDEISDDTDLSAEIINIVSDLGLVFWDPSSWSANENSSNTTINIASLVQLIIDRNSFVSGDHLILKIVTLDTTNRGNFRTAATDPELNLYYINDSAGIVSGGFQSNKSYHLRFEFEDNLSFRWVRVVTTNTDNNPNPVIDLRKRLRFRYFLPEGSLYFTMGIREIENTHLNIGDNGGINGPIEWVGTTEVLMHDDQFVPKGILLKSDSSTWNEIDIDLSSATAVSFENGNNSLDSIFGTIEHFAFTIDPDDPPDGPINIYIDQIEQVSDVLVAGTSQGLLLSENFGTIWETIRLTNTPVHKFYKPEQNPYLWAISATQVMLATNPKFWFVSRGTQNIQFIRDIVEDNNGNIFISTDRGVYWLEQRFIRNFNQFTQTQPINAFTTDCYGLYHDDTDIWVSTEIGIFKTQNSGESWSETNLFDLGMPIYQFINIGTIENPTIIGCTRKHIIRKLHNESQFSVIANFEEQLNIFDIWKISYFNGCLYVSTGSGVFKNNLDVLFTPGITNIVFETIFPETQRNSFISVVFGLDTVRLNNEDEQLFLGQENRLLVSDTNNKTSLKIEYNAEFPGFYINNVSASIGYIYNNFNNIICFREPLQTLDIISADYLPRKTYETKFGGWSETRPDTDVFLYVNNIPQWLDWKLDEASLLGDLQTLEGQLNNLPDLTTFNSLYPQSQNFLNKCLAGIINLKTGGDNGASLINNNTITQLFADYTRFVSLIIPDLQKNINTPQVLLNGISPQNRTSTRASTLEEQQNFKALDATNIVIDTVTGTIDFSTAIQNSTNLTTKQQYQFGKHDLLQITVFNTHIKNTGDHTHRELEDRFEDINTGLTSDLSQTVSANLIKAGIYLENRNHFLHDLYQVSNIQSKFYGAFTNTWYDILNSTIDYQSVISTENNSQPHIATVIQSFPEDPYLSQSIWVGTDNNILEYNVQNEVELSNYLSPLGDNWYIRDIYNHPTAIYITLDNQNTSHRSILYTHDHGDNWNEMILTNLPLHIYNMRILNGNFITGTNTGLFYTHDGFDQWSQPELIVSDKITDVNGIKNAFLGNIFNVYQETFLIAESDRWIYFSREGLEYLGIGRLTNNNAKSINRIHRFKNITYFATDVGLYNDGNSVLSDNIVFGLEQIENNLDNSIVPINDICSYGDTLYCAGANGKIYRFFDSGSGNEWLGYKVDGFSTIHKIHAFSSTQMIVTSFGEIKVLDVTNGSGVFN